MRRTFLLMVIDEQVVLVYLKRKKKRLESKSCLQSSSQSLAVLSQGSTLLRTENWKGDDTGRRIPGLQLATLIVRGGCTCHLLAAVNSLRSESHAFTPAVMFQSGEPVHGQGQAVALEYWPKLALWNIQPFCLAQY